MEGLFFISLTNSAAHRCKNYPR
ncbi:MAG: hypothetical protein JWQ01_3542, partial [Massilia sp.]|nr:hypothetical protein [Massilia sp.]